MKLVVVYFGRFQPVHVGHVAVYRHLVKIFGAKNVYIGTSNKVDAETAPLTFEWKKKLWVKHGVPEDKILQTRIPYQPEIVGEILNLDPSEFKFLVAVGEKDKSRLSGSNFYEPIYQVDDMEPASQRGYTYTVPNVKVNGNVIHAKSIRDTLQRDNLNPEDVEYLRRMMGVKKRDILHMKQIFEHQKLKRWWKLITEGGSSGHMSHPFDDLNMTFADLREIIDSAFQGKLEVTSEGPITEKVDGQNLWASIINGQVRFARNKGQLKNYGENSMDLLAIESKWDGNIKAAFLKAAQTLTDGLSSMSDKLKWEIFKNGQNWVNFELITHDNPNVINYEEEQIIFHNIQMVDTNGNPIKSDSSAAIALFKVFSKAQRSSKLTMKIAPPKIVRVNKDLTIDFAEDRAEFMSDINRIRDSAGLSDSSTIGDMLRHHWGKKLDAVESKHYVDLSPIRRPLLKRFVEGDKSYRITNLPSDVNDAGAIDALRDLDRNSHTINKDLIKPLELLVLRFGVVLLQNIDTFLSVNTDAATQQLRLQIDQQIATIRRSGNVDDIERMQALLQKIDAIGGFEAIVPSEGIVFRYKGKVYKITGLFAPVNQLMGIGRFARG